jgi:hypothetical protein
MKNGSNVIIIYLCQYFLHFIVRHLSRGRRVKLVPSTTKVVSSKHSHGDVNSIQHYVWKFVSDLPQVGGFLRVLMDYSTNKPDRHEITEILLKVTLNTITITPQLTTIYWSQQSTGHNNLLVTTIYWSQQSTGHNNLQVTTIYWSLWATGHNNLLVTTIYWSLWATGHNNLLVTMSYWKLSCMWRGNARFSKHMVLIYVYMCIFLDSSIGRVVTCRGENMSHTPWSGIYFLQVYWLVTNRHLNEKQRHPRTHYSYFLSTYIITYGNIP